MDEADTAHMRDGLDGERGTVPEGARTAMVCMKAGQPTGFVYQTF